MSRVSIALVTGTFFGAIHAFRLLNLVFGAVALLSNRVVHGAHLDHQLGPAFKGALTGACNPEQAADLYI